MPKLMLKFNQGFTLLEIIIVIALMTILLGAATVSYNSFGDQKRLEQDAEMVRDKISFTRERAVGQDMSPRSDCFRLWGYEITFNTPQTIIIEILCTDASCLFMQETPETTVETIILQNSTIASGNSFQLQTPYGCTNNTCMDTPKTITFQSINGQQCVDITIDQFGKSAIGQPYDC